MIDDTTPPEKEPPSCLNWGGTPMVDSMLGYVCEVQTYRKDGVVKAVAERCEYCPCH